MDGWKDSALVPPTFPLEVRSYVVCCHLYLRFSHAAIKAQKEKKILEYL